MTMPDIADCFKILYANSHRLVVDKEVSDKSDRQRVFEYFKSSFVEVQVTDKEVDAIFDKVKTFHVENLGKDNRTKIDKRNRQMLLCALEDHDKWLYKKLKNSATPLDINKLRFTKKALRERFMKAEGFEIPSAEKKKDGHKERIQEEVFEPIPPSDGDFLFGHDVPIPITCEDVIDHMKSCIRCSKVIKGHFDTQRELREQPMNSLTAQFANVELNLVGAEERKEADEGDDEEAEEEKEEAKQTPFKAKEPRKCGNCGLTGHYAPRCPELSELSE